MTAKKRKFLAGILLECMGDCIRPQDVAEKILYNFTMIKETKELYEVETFDFDNDEFDDAVDEIESDIRQLLKELING